MVLLRRVRIPFLGLLVATQALAAETKFSHQLHLNKVGATCTICHSAASASKESADRNLPTEETCLACHNGESPVGGYRLARRARTRMSEHSASITNT